MNTVTSPTTSHGALRWLLAAVCTAALGLASCSSDSEDTRLPTDSDGGSMPSFTIDLVPDRIENTGIGRVFAVEETGLTLYLRAADTPDTVTCIDDCATTWPPLITAVTQQGISGDYDVIERPDGTYQWTYGGYPLHTYSGDAAVGDVTGDDVESWSVARPTPVTSGDNSGTEILVAAGSTITAAGDASTRNDRDGHTFYVFANDTADTSNCDDNCAMAWPAVHADRGAIATGNFSIYTRTDGQSAWAYNSAPLYFYSGDNAAGDTTGDGIDGVWSIAQP